MTDLLGRLDAAISGLCPCGAEPREGSAYCCYDCEPTHIIESVDGREGTDTRTSGAFATPMRWRLDLVTAVDDSDLIPLGSQTFYTGRFHAQLFQRAELVDGATTWHLRLDDGHRFVGADMDATGTPAELSDRIDAKWAALERELGNSRHIEADPWADVVARVFAGMDQEFLGIATTSARAGEAVTFQVEPPTVQAGGYSSGVWVASAGVNPDDFRSWTNLGYIAEDGVTYPTPPVIRFDNRELTLRTVRTAGQVNQTLEALARAFQSSVASVRQAFPALAPEPVPEHPMLQAIEQRRNRNTGPEQQQRAPRQINPRRLR